MPLSDIAPLIGAGIGVASNELFKDQNDRRQVKQQKNLNAVNARTAKELADYEQSLRMKMWNDTNYGAQLEQAEKAGISKAALFGGGGGGIATTAGASVGSGTGSQAADSARTQSANAGTIMTAAQLGLMTAQKENIEADTANKKAGAGKSTTEAEGASQENRIKTVNADNAEKLKEEARYGQQGIYKSQAVQGTNDEVNQLDKQEIVKQAAIGSKIENAAKQTGINLDNARIGEIVNKIQQEWAKIENTKTDMNIKISNMEMLTKTMLQAAGINAAGNVVKGIVDIAGKRIPKKQDESRKDMSFEQWLQSQQ